jgi:hypothetical protein
MAKPLLRFEVPDTRRFTVAYSSAPGVAPYFALYYGSASTLIHSVTGTASDATHYYTHYLLPASRTIYMFEWVASYTTGPVVVRGMLKTVRSEPLHYE